MTDATGALPQNILYFARALREAGLPVGPASVVDAIEAAQAAGLGNREDFRATLHAVLVKTHDNSIIFNQAFDQSRNDNGGGISIASETSILMFDMRGRGTSP